MHGLYFFPLASVRAMSDVTPSAPALSAVPQPTSELGALSPDLLEVGAAVQHFVQANGPQPGSVIGGYLGKSFAFSARSRGLPSLTAFLREYVPSLRPVGQSGDDIVWGLAGEEQDRSDIGEVVWQAVTSPNSARRVAVLVHLPTGQWAGRTIPDGEPIAGLNPPELTGVSPEQMVPDDPEWRRVFPLSTTVHEEFAKRFLQREDIGPLRAVLEDALQRPRWWMRWRQLLGTRPDLLQVWIDERSRSIHALLQETLESFGMQDAVIERALRVPAPGRPANDAEESPDPLPVRRGNRTSVVPKRNLGDDAALRAIAIAVLERLSAAELRELRLPLGIVLDALRENGS